MSRLARLQPEILAAFLCEFHAIQGPRIALAVSSGSPTAPSITSIESISPIPTNGDNYTNLDRSPINTRQSEMEGTDLLAAMSQKDPIPAPTNRKSSSSIPATPTHQSSFHHPLEPQYITEHQVNTEPSHPPLLSDLFDSISEYLIPKPALCGSLTSIAVNKYRMIGHPVLLEDSKYPRNVALWNIVMVVDRGADARGLNACVTKLAKSFKALELESEYVTNPQYRHSLYAVLSQIVHDLNTLREVRIELPHTNVVLDMHLAPVTPVQVSKVHFWQVPVLLMDLTSVNTSKWDLSACRIIPLINGVRSISAIATLAGMDSSLVRVAVQHLMTTGVVVLVDLFQFTNVYTPTSRIRQVANDPWLQHQCIQYILRPIHSDMTTQSARDGKNTGDDTSTTSTIQPPKMNTYKDNAVKAENEGVPALVSMIDGVPVNATGEITGTRLVSMYAAMRPGLTIAEWISLTEFPVVIADVRRFVTFGVIKGWIRRVHAYPIHISNSKLTSEADTNQVFVLDNYGGGNGSIPKIPSATKIISHHSTGHSILHSATHFHPNPEPGSTSTPEYGLMSKIGGSGSEIKSITLIPTSATNTTTIITSNNATTISKSVGAGMTGGKIEHESHLLPMGPLSWPMLHMRDGAVAADFVYVTDDGLGRDRSLGGELIPLDGMCVEYKKNEAQVKELWNWLVMENLLRAALGLASPPLSKSEVNRFPAQTPNSLALAKQLRASLQYAFTHISHSNSISTYSDRSIHHERPPSREYYPSNSSPPEMRSLAGQPLSPPASIARFLVGVTNPLPFVLPNGSNMPPISHLVNCASSIASIYVVPPVITNRYNWSDQSFPTNSFSQSMSSFSNNESMPSPALSRTTPELVSNPPLALDHDTACMEMKQAAQTILRMMDDWHVVNTVTTTPIKSNFNLPLDDDCQSSLSSLSTSLNSTTAICETNPESSTGGTDLAPIKADGSSTTLATTQQRSRAHSLQQPTLRLTNSHVSILSKMNKPVSNVRSTRRRSLSASEHLILGQLMHRPLVHQLNSVVHPVNSTRSIKHPEEPLKVVETPLRDTVPLHREPKLPKIKITMTKNKNRELNKLADYLRAPTPSVENRSPRSRSSTTTSFVPQDDVASTLQHEHTNIPLESGYVPSHGHPKRKNRRRVSPRMKRRRLSNTSLSVSYHNDGHAQIEIPALKNSIIQDIPALKNSIIQDKIAFSSLLPDNTKDYCHNDLLSIPSSPE